MSGADLVLVGDVAAVDRADGWARAVAIAGDRIVAVGTEDEVRERVGAADEIVRGACIVPGFQDAHIHAAFAGRILLNVNLDDLATRDAYLERIADRIGAYVTALEPLLRAELPQLDVRRPLRDHARRPLDGLRNVFYAAGTRQRVADAVDGCADQ